MRAIEQLSVEETEEVRRRRVGPTLDIEGSRTHTDDEGSVAQPDVRVPTDNEAIGPLLAKNWQSRNATLLKML